MLFKQTLKKSPDQALESFRAIESALDLSAFFEVNYRRIRYLLYSQPEEAKYTSFEIPKRTGGMREINRPLGGIDILQQKLLPILKHFYVPKPCAHGFIEGRSVVTNAKPHANSRYVFNVDLKDFYGSINFGRVRGMFIAKPFEVEASAATVLAQLVTFKKRLPQGSCTSPIISNIIARALDGKLTQLARRYHCTYTRYADDITFSTSKRKFPTGLAILDEPNPVTISTSVGHALRTAIESSGFLINESKVRMQIRSIRQEVTGITVNQFPNVRRKFVRQIRAMIHAWRTFGLENAELEYLEKYCSKEEVAAGSFGGDYFRNVVYGKLAYLKMVRSGDDVVFCNLAASVSELDSDPPDFIKVARMKANTFDVFICHASEDKKSVALPLEKECEKIGLKAFVDQNNINWGDSITQIINKALSQARFFVAVISDSSVNKEWPMKELNSAIAREIDGEHKILPLVVGDADKVLKDLPLLKDQMYLKWNGKPKSLAEKIARLKGGTTSKKKATKKKVTKKKVTKKKATKKKVTKKKATKKKVTKKKATKKKVTKKKVTKKKATKKKATKKKATKKKATKKKATKKKATKKKATTKKKKATKRKR